MYSSPLEAIHIHNCYFCENSSNLEQLLNSAQKCIRVRKSSVVEEKNEKHKTVKQILKKCLISKSPKKKKCSLDNRTPEQVVQDEKLRFLETGKFSPKLILKSFRKHNMLNNDEYGYFKVQTLNLQNLSDEDVW